MRSLPTPIMMVCAGNLCRSPFAEHYMRMQLKKAGVAGECYSRGLLALPGSRVPELALQVAAEFDVDLRRHISQALLLPDLERAALVMVMEPVQRQHLGKLQPASIGKVMLLSQPGGGGVIDDPMGKDEACFRRVYREIADLVDAWLARFGVV